MAFEEGAAYVNTEKKTQAAVHVLLVDDKPQNLFSLERTLSSPDLILHKANSGNEALSLLLEREYACILLDVQMPGMDGFEVARIIRDDPKVHRLPIIFITAYDQGEFDMLRAYGTGAVDVLFKPLDPMIVRSKVEVFAELYRSRGIIQDQTEQLKAANRELQHLAYSCSHDLKEPLRMVATYVQMLNRKYYDQLDETAREFIGFAVDGSRRMARIIDDMLEYAQTGEASITPRAVDTSEVVRRVLHDLGQQISEAQAEVTVEKLPVVSGDETLIRRVFQNLISNAIKYRRDVPAKVRVSVASAPDRSYDFCIEDNGLGFDMKYADRIFSMFARLHDRSKTTGSGIGLATCKRILELHGGRIWVDSREGEGSRFYFRLPEAIGAGHASAQSA